MSAPLRDVGSSLDTVLCPHCGAVVHEAVDPNNLEWDATPGCPHVFVLGHDLGIEFLSEAARLQLEAAGIAVEDYPEGGIELPEEEDESWLETIDRAISLPGAEVLAVYAPAPVFDGTYIGIAETA